MKKRVLFLFSCALLFLLASCELFVPKMPKGKMHIVVYGNDYKGYFKNPDMFVIYYPDSKPSLNIQTTVNDAVQVGNALSVMAEKSNRDYAISYYVGANMTYGNNNPIPGLPDGSLSNVTVSQDLSKEALRNAFSSIVESQKEETDGGKDDVFIFFYSGHGDYKGDEGTFVEYGEDLLSQGCFIMGTPRTDVSYSNAPYFERYAFDEFYEDIEKINGQKIIIADCCFSGCLVPVDGFSTNDILYDGVSLHSLYKNAEPNGANDIFVFSASEYFSESYYSANDSHSYFTKVLLYAMGWDENKEEGKRLGEIPALNGDKTLTLQGLYREVTVESRNFFNLQHDILSGGSYDAVLFQF